MRIFLDVGAHEGQTLEAVTGYHFDRIYAFEPMPAQFALLEERFGDLPAVTLLNYGLADRTGQMPLYGTNEEMEASFYPAKDGVDPTVTTICKVRSASEFLAELPDAEVVVKLNCEGAEVPILDDLLDTGLIWKIDRLMIDFDTGKIEGMEDEEGRILERLLEIGFDRFSLCAEVMMGETHVERIGTWLGWP